MRSLIDLSRAPLSRSVRAFVILLVLGFAARAHADDRSEARAHYQTAVKLYSGADYRGAIREFSAAQQLVPADLNNYNLALCYDKLGDAEPAIQYYRAFLDKQPNTDKRAEIEASIARLDAASKSIASKKADEARKAEDARKAEAARAEADAKRPVLGPAPSPDAPPAPSAPVLGPAPAPTGTGNAPSVAVGPAPADGPSVGPAPAASEPARKPKKKAVATAAPSANGTGDPQLDRINAINIDEIRDQRVGGDARDPRSPAIAANAPTAAGQAPTNAPPTNVAPTPTPASGAPDEPKKERPVYTKWWFWAVVAVGAYVAYEVATTDSSQSGSRTFSKSASAPPSSGGLTLLRW